jgi:hypothetical protein
MGTFKGHLVVSLGCFGRRESLDPSRSVALQEREVVGGPFGRLLERRPVAAVVEKHEVPIDNVVEDRDRDLERHYPVVPTADQQDARLDAGEVRRAHAGLCRDADFHLGDAVDQV